MEIAEKFHTRQLVEKFTEINIGNAIHTTPL